MANHDGLTGLLNRRAFDRQANQIFQRYLRTPHARGALRIAMIDIDYFKRYNDHHGHPAGDTVLHAVATTLAAQLRGSDSVVARYGGEEFVALGTGRRDNRNQRRSSSFGNRCRRWRSHMPIRMRPRW